MSSANQTACIGSWYRDHHSWLYGWLCRKMHNNSDAADLAQDTFVRVLTAANTTAVREPRALLLTIARRALIDLWRRREIEQAWLDYQESLPEALAPSAEELSTLLEALEQVSKLLSGLPAEVRRAFLLNRLDGKTHRAIAEEMHISIATVERYIKRAFIHCCLQQEVMQPL